MIILGLTGYAGCGKGTVADYLVSQFGFIKFSFAQALRDEVQEAYGLPDQDLLTNRATKEVPSDRLTAERCLDFEFRAVLRKLLAAEQLVDAGIFSVEDLDAHPLSPRQILQWWGTEYRRAQTDNYWLHRAEDFIQMAQQGSVYPEQTPQYFVCDDCRFPNEQEWIHSGYTANLHWAGNLWHIRRGDLKPVNGHVSDQGLPVLDGERELWNNDTIERLHKGVDLLITSTAQFVKVLPMEVAIIGDELNTPEKEAAVLPNGQYYSKQADGHMMLCNADGSRSVFDDVDD